MMRVSIGQRRARLARRHLLAVPASSVDAVTTALVGIHSSDPASVHLAARARLAGFDVAHMEDALYERRSLVRMLGMRRTMFVVDHATAAVMNAACTQALAAGERRKLTKLLEDQGITADGAKWLRRVEQKALSALAELGEATASELTKVVPEFKQRLMMGEGKTWAAEAGVSTRVLFLLATDARIVRGRPLGSWISSQYRWATTASWIEPLPPIEPVVARAELLRRWLYAFGPGTLRDITWWTGWSQRDAKVALAAVEAIEVEVGHESGTPAVGYLLPDDTGSVRAPKAWVAFLPGLDPTVMGWKERDWYLGAHAPRLFDRNGNAGPTVWADGQVIGGWAQRADGQVVTEVLEPAARPIAAAVADEARRVTAWLDGIVVTPRFRTPLEKSLRA